MTNHENHYVSPMISPWDLLLCSDHCCSHDVLVSHVSFPFAPHHPRRVVRAVYVMKMKSVELFRQRRSYLRQQRRRVCGSVCASNGIRTRDLDLDRGHGHGENDESDVLCCGLLHRDRRLYRAGYCGARSGGWWNPLFHHLAFLHPHLRVCGIVDGDVHDGVLRGLGLLRRRWWSDDDGNGDDGIGGGRESEIL